MEGRIIDGSPLPMTADDACLNVVYKEEIDSDASNSNQEEVIGDHEYIIVTLDENQSLDSLLSNLSQHPQLHSQLPRDFVLVASNDECDDSDTMDNEVLTALPPPPDLVWGGQGEIDLRKLSDDEDVENTVPRDQIIYVNTEDVVATDPDEQYIVLEPGCAKFKLIDGEIPVTSPSPLRYDIAPCETDPLSTGELVTSRHVIVDPLSTRRSADQILSMTTSSTSKSASPYVTSTSSSVSAPLSPSTSSSSSSSSFTVQSKRVVDRKVAPKAKRARLMKKKSVTNELEGDQSKDFQCTLCKAYTFDLKSHLKLHCDVCNVFMSDPELLKTHKLNHTKAVGHCSCGICGEKFDSSELLRGHLQINGYHRSSFNSPVAKSGKKK